MSWPELANHSVRVPVWQKQSAGPINCLEYSARVLYCTIVTRAAMLMFPLLLQSIISNQMRPRKLRGVWFSRLLRHPARRQSGSILSPGTHNLNLRTNFADADNAGTTKDQKFSVAPVECRCVLFHASRTSIKKTEYMQNVLTEYVLDD